MRRISNNRDRNEKGLIELIEAYRGAWVPIREKNAPDGVIGFRGADHLVEVKVEDGRVSPGQKDFHASWPGGKIEVVRSEAELEALLRYWQTTGNWRAEVLAVANTLDNRLTPASGDTLQGIVVRAMLRLRRLAEEPGR